MPVLALAGVAVALVVLVYAPGALLAPALGMRDGFARVWCGLAATSLVGLALALARVFSLPALLVGVLAVALAARLVTRGRAAMPSPPSRAGAVAWIAAAVVFAWCWPPYETTIAASDSTMYLNAGIHLARSGRLDVPDSVIGLLPPSVAEHVFPSVSLGGVGPFIRLPGGLLLRSLADRSAAPAFFPLTSVSAGIFAAAGGPRAAPLVAPVFAGLGAAAVVLFAGETLGVATAACAGVLLVANFAVWWFGRFTTAETAALTFVWGGLVFLARALRQGETAGAGDATAAAVQRRGAAFAAGLCLGLAGVARNETFLFVAAAVALWWVWSRRDAPVPTIAAGFVVAAAGTVATLLRLPTHHLAYVANDALLTFLETAPALVAARESAWAVLVWAVPIALVVAGGIVGRWRGAGFVVGALRVLLPLAVAATVAVYARIGGALHPVRHLGWLVTYCSWPLVVLAVPGVVIAVSRGGGATRVAVVLAALVATVFVLDPRVAPYQPWAIRRFLPVVIPALVLGAAAALGTAAAARARAVRIAAWVVVIAIAVLEVRPVLAARRHAYFEGSFAAAATLADAFAENAIVVFDAALSDVQLQVPVWLTHGRETIVLNDQNVPWRESLRAFVATDRPVYWVGNRYAPAPTIPGLVFEPEGEPTDIAVPLPDAPADATPRTVVTRIVPLRIYRVRAAA